MEELLKTFTIPDNTVMEEHTIVVEGGAIIGNHSDIGFGIIADSIISGERVKIKGNVVGTEDIRIDMWSHIGGDVRTKQDAYIGEFVNIEGKLVVEGDLDIGKDVKILGGFDAKGWIVVRNPIPVLIYVFLYLTELLRLGKDEEVEKALNDIFVDDSDDLNEDKLLIIPSGSKVDLELIRVPEKAIIGNGCRMMGNIRAASLKMGNDNTLFGSIRTVDEVVIGEQNKIHGNIVTRGDVLIHKDTHILGEINGGKIFVHEEARVDGAMRAPGGVVISSELMKKEPEETVVGLLDLAEKRLDEKKEKGAQKKPVKASPAKKTPAKASRSSTSRSAPKEEHVSIASDQEPAIPPKRMITAVRVSEQEKAVETKKKPVARKKAVSTTVSKTGARKTTAKSAPNKRKQTKKTTASTTASGKSSKEGARKTAAKSTSNKGSSTKKTAAKTTAKKKPPAKKTVASKDKSVKTATKKSPATKKKTPTSSKSSAEK